MLIMLKHGKSCYKYASNIYLIQGLATYGTRANSGTQRDNRWHVSNREEREREMWEL